jgi:hypothetical protein
MYATLGLDCSEHRERVQREGLRDQCAHQYRLSGHQNFRVQFRRALGALR